MRRASIGTLALLLTLAAAACAARREPVRVDASPTDLGTLVGEWAGEYSGATSGRSGSIVFTLRAGRDTAFGDVVRVPAGAAEPLSAGKYSGTGTPGAAGTVGVAQRGVGLTIRFVRVSSDSVSGALDPYEVPGCNCRLTTTFVGAAAGDRISGTFATLGDPAGGTQTGRWAVTRRRR
jgi:hypothetical protein